MTQALKKKGCLAKELTFGQVWSLALGAIIGWGCFVLPGDVFLPNAGPMATLIGFFIGAVLLSIVALTYAYMIEYAPVAGGEYAYAFVGYGPTVAFFCGWVLVAGYIAIIALGASAVTFLLRYYLPGVFEVGELYTIAGWRVYTGEVILMYLLLLFFGGLNYFGVSSAGKIQVFLAFCLSFGIIALFIGVVFLETASISNLQPAFAEHRSPWLSIASVLAIAPFLYVGFDAVPQVAEEFSFPVKKARNIMVIAIFWGFLLYSLVTLAVGLAIPYPELLAQMNALKAEGGTAWATGEVCKLAFGEWGALIMGTAVLGAACTGINGFYMAASRLLISMARGGVLPAWLAEVHPKYHTPHKAIIFCMATVVLTPWSGRAIVVWIVDMSAVGTSIAYLLTSFVAYRIIKNRDDVEHFVWKSIICIIGITTSFLCLALLLLPFSPGFIDFAPRMAMLVWLIAGTLFYFKMKPTWSSMSETELRQNILGDPNIPVFYKKR